MLYASYNFPGVVTRAEGAERGRWIDWVTQIVWTIHAEALKGGSGAEIVVLVSWSDSVERMAGLPGFGESRQGILSSRWDSPEGMMDDHDFEAT